MRGILIAAACAVAVVACGGDDKPSPEEQLQGTWVTEIDGCDYGVSFDDSDVYEIDFVCALQGGGYGVQAEVGKYSADDDTLRLTPTHSTCKAATGMGGSGGYSIKGDTLTLVAKRGALQLLHIEESQKQATGQNGVAKFGCWNEDDTFTAGELEKL